MGATLSTTQITKYTLTPVGPGGYWWTAIGQGNTVYQINYSQGTTESLAELYAVDTFWDLMVEMHTRGIGLPSVEIRINLEDIANRNGLMSQFTSLTGQQIDQIAANFNEVEIIKMLGVFPLLRKFYNRGHLTLLQVQNILIYLGKEEKITRMKAESAIKFLLNKGDITQPQADAFWVLWDAQVGN